MRRPQGNLPLGSPGARCLPTNGGQIETRKGVHRAWGGAALLRTSVGETGGHCRRRTPRASAKLPEAASGMEKQEEREWRGPAAGFHPQGCRRSREPFPGSVLTAVTAWPRAFPCVRGPADFADTGLLVEESPRSSTRQRPSPVSPWAPGPRHHKEDPHHPHPRNQAVSAGSAWPCVLRSPSWARAAAHWGSSTRDPEGCRSTQTSQSRAQQRVCGPPAGRRPLAAGSVRPQCPASGGQWAGGQV